MNTSLKSPSTKPSVTSRTIGIDLGTTRSVVAFIDAHGYPQTVINGDGDMTTPSAVAFEGGTVLVGKDAIKSLSITPDRVVQFAKREIGTQRYMISVDGVDYPAELIESFILGRLRRDAERHFGETIQDAVITVPAFFNEPKRRATMDAGMLAGLNVKAVINEPTAAALAYGVEHGLMNEEGVFANSQTVLVYDLGGGTFDVSILKIKGDSIDVIAVDGNSRLGGLDWDECILEWISEQFRTQCKASNQQLKASRGILLKEAEEIKHSLTSREKVAVKIRLDEHILQTHINRALFNSLTAHLLDRTRFTLRKVLDESKLKWNQIERVLLVGGSTRMPQVIEMLRKETKSILDQSVSPDQAVAYGAAVYGRILSERDEMDFDLDGISETGKDGAMRITDVNAHHLGVLGVELKTGRPQGQVIIPKNTPLPAMNIARFKTAKPNQKSVVVKVIEGGDLRGQNATTIGTFSVRDLPPGLPAGSPVDVVLRYNHDGIIQAEAIVVATGKKNHIEIKRQAGLSLDEIDGWQDASKDIFEALGLD